jgi:hypothetical protein
VIQKAAVSSSSSEEGEKVVKELFNGAYNKNEESFCNSR